MESSGDAAKSSRSRADDECLVKTDAFWATESGALLLDRNAGFVSAGNAFEICERAKRWFDLIPGDKLENIKARVAQNWSTGKCEAPENDRIFRLDAERTFVSPESRACLYEILTSVHNDIRDYHQGMGFIAAFFSLFLSPEEAAQLVLHLNDSVMPGYFKTEAFAYFRDAKVFHKLLESQEPNVHKVFERQTLLPELYCSKWFVGMTIHVLNFEAIFRHVELLLEKGQVQIFSFGLSVVSRLEAKLANARDVSDLLSLLRLDKKFFTIDQKRDGAVESVVEKDKLGGFYLDLVEHSLEIQIDIEEIEKLRSIAIEDMRIAAEEREKKKKALEDSDDEIVFSDEE